MPTSSTAIHRAGLAALLVLTSACAGESATRATTGSAATATPSTPASATATADPPGSEADQAAQAAASEVAVAYLTAVVTQDVETAYALLSPAAQATVTPEEFAFRRQTREATARGLNQVPLVTGAAGDAQRVTVAVEGRRADGTRVDLALPLVTVGTAWRVDEVPDV